MTTRNHFKDFSEQDFINDKDFQDWVISSDEEKDRFWQVFLAKHPEKKEAIEKARALLMSIAFKESWPAEEKVEGSLTEALNAISQTDANAPVYEMYNKRKPLYRAWIAAAAVLLFLVLGLWFLAGRERVQEPSVAVTPKVEDIAPGGNKAVLTLADGTRVVLDTANNGALTKQGNVTVIKLNGKLAYNKEDSAAAEVLYNTISTPRGGQYQLVLADGSKVWLNAASSLRFPTVFAGKERRVELTGEGYFEVAHNEEMPFHVMVNDMDVQVLGTHFNINAYSDEPVVRTTLLQGKVLVKKNKKLVYLNPGQQAVIQPGDQDSIRVGDKVNTEEVVAWKNGYFLFSSADIETVMRQVARWYDVDVVYQEKTNETISGGLPRSQALSQLVKILEATGKLDLEIKGKQIIVKPK